MPEPQTDPFPDLTVDEPPPAERESVAAEPVFIRLIGPFGTTAFKMSPESGGTLVVTKQGVFVPPGDVDALLAAAARSGISLAQGK